MITNLTKTSFDTSLLNKEYLTEIVSKSTKVSLSSTQIVRGADGVSGKDGLSAYEIAVNNGFIGTEQEWLDSLNGMNGMDGMNGLTAYEIAVNNGFIGTEQEWLDSLNGSGTSTQIDESIYGGQISEDFNVFSPNSTSFLPWSGVPNNGAIPINSYPSGINTKTFLGSIGIYGSASLTNSAYAFTTALSGIPLFGGEETNLVMAFTSVSDVYNRFGLFANSDSTVTIIGKTVVSGVYFDFVNGTLTGKITYNSNTVSTATFTPIVNKFYKMRITTDWDGVNGNPIYATFQIFYEGTIVFNETISLGFNTVRVSNLVISQCVNAGRGVISYIDYIDFKRTTPLMR